MEVTTPQAPLLFVFAFVFIIPKKSRIIFSCDLHQTFISCKDVFYSFQFNYDYFWFSLDNGSYPN